MQKNNKRSLITSPLKPMSRCKMTHFYNPRAIDIDNDVNNINNSSSSNQVDTAEGRRQRRFDSLSRVLGLSTTHTACTAVTIFNSEIIIASNCADGQDPRAIAQSLRKRLQDLRSILVKHLKDKDKNLALGDISEAATYFADDIVTLKKNSGLIQNSSDIPQALYKLIKSMSGTDDLSTQDYAFTDEEIVALLESTHVTILVPAEEEWECSTAELDLSDITMFGSPTGQLSSSSSRVTMTNSSSSSSLPTAFPSLNSLASTTSTVNLYRHHNDNSNTTVFTSPIRGANLNNGFSDYWAEVDRSESESESEPESESNSSSSSESDSDSSVGFWGKGGKPVVDAASSSDSDTSSNSESDSDSDLSDASTVIAKTDDVEDFCVNSIVASARKMSISMDRTFEDGEPTADGIIRYCMNIYQNDQIVPISFPESIYQGLKKSYNVSGFHAEQLIAFYLQQVLNVDLHDKNAPPIPFGISKLCCDACAILYNFARIKLRGASFNNFEGVPIIVSPLSDADVAVAARPVTPPATQNPQSAEDYQTPKPENNASTAPRSPWSK
jgi:hypothetical protein